MTISVDTSFCALFLYLYFVVVPKNSSVADAHTTDGVLDSLQLTQWTVTYDMFV
jgi:hypothetical protein